MEDTDAEGIVYYVNYLKFMERARSDWLRAQAIWQRPLQKEGKQFVVSDCRIKYRRPAHLDDELHVTVAVSRLGRASITFQQEVWRGEELLCDAEVKVACVSCHNMTPTRLPEALMAMTATR